MRMLVCKIPTYLQRKPLSKEASCCLPVNVTNCSSGPQSTTKFILKEVGLSSSSTRSLRPGSTRKNLQSALPKLLRLCLSVNGVTTSMKTGQLKMIVKHSFGIGIIIGLLPMRSCKLRLRCQSATRKFLDPQILKTEVFCPTHQFRRWS